MGEHFDKIKDPELKEAIKWQAKNAYMENMSMMRSQIEARGDKAPLVEHAKHEIEYIENGCENLAAMGDHSNILKAYRAQYTHEGKNWVQKNEEVMKAIEKIKGYPSSSEDINNIHHGLSIGTLGEEKGPFKG